MNNVNADEMKKFVGALGKDPSLGKKNKKVTGTWSFDQGKPQFAATLEFPKGKSTINAELPPFAGG